MDFNINSLSLTFTIVSIILFTIIVYLVIFIYKKYAKSKNRTTAENASSSDNEYKDNIQVTKDVFDKINNGMSYEEVIGIIGGEGEVISESGQKGDKFYIVMYKYKGVGDIAANVNLIFQGGKLINKSQIGLK